ncbi:MAG: transposase [Alphaproteobacteria bacterium]|nr:transposase [Alphaproteobacteria bacterium]
MSRIARVVVPGLPHHVTQRGNNRAPIFFQPGDQDLYRDLLAARCRKAGVAVWAYCLMPNHVHLIMVPARADGLARAVGEAHRRYTAFVNARARQTGHLFQARFSSVPMDEGHLAAALRYVALNPVRARLVARAADWPWSSVAAHLAGRDDALASVAPALDRFPDFAALIETEPTEAELAAIRAGESIGRPLGSPAFVADLERRLGRRLIPRKRGPRPKSSGEGEDLLI